MHKRLYADVQLATEAHASAFLSGFFLTVFFLFGWLLLPSAAIPVHPASLGAFIGLNLGALDFLGGFLTTHQGLLVQAIGLVLLILQSRHIRGFAAKDLKIGLTRTRHNPILRFF